MSLFGPEFNPKVTVRTLIYETQKHKKTRFDFAERDCIIKSIQVKRVTSYSRFNTPRETFEISSTSYPNYGEYLSKGKAKQRTVKHTYPVSMSFFIDKDDIGKPITLDTPVKIRTGKGGKWPKIKKKQLKEVQSKDNPNAKYKSVNDLIAQEYQINGDFYWRNSYMRAFYGCLYGKNYAPKGEAPSSKSVKKRVKKSKSGKVTPRTDILFLTKHEIAVIHVLLKQKIIVDHYNERDSLITPERK